MDYKNKLCEFERPECEEYNLKGYVLDYSNDWTLIHVASSDMFLNGYTIFRNDDVKRYRLVDDYNNFFDRALKKLGFKPIKPKGINLKNIDSIIESVNFLYPIFTVHYEKIANDVCYIGNILKATPKTFTLSLISPGAKYSGTHRFFKKDITRIEFKGQYENTLWLMASQQTKKKFKKV